MKIFFIALMFFSMQSWAQSSAPLCRSDITLSDSHRERLSRMLQVHPRTINLVRVRPPEFYPRSDFSVGGEDAYRNTDRPGTITKMLTPGPPILRKGCSMVLHHPKGTSYCEIRVYSNRSFEILGCE